MKKLTLILISILYLHQAQSQVTNGLIAKYYFNSGNANDDVGRYHGKVNGAVLTTDRFGNPNKAYQFGQNQNITINDTDALDGMTNGLSISFWVKTLTLSNSNTLISKFSYCGGGSDAYNIYINNNRLISQFDDDFGTDAYQFGKKIITDDKWHHIVVVWNKPYIIFYIDTILDSFSRNDQFNSTFSNSDEVLAFGHPKTVYCPYTYDYNEKLDDIRIYNRALTKIEVDTLFNESNPIKSSTLTSVEHSISIYPNPTDGLVKIEGLIKPTDIFLYSMDGKLIKQYYTKEYIHTSELNDGTYLLKIDEKTFKINIKK